MPPFPFPPFSLLPTYQLLTILSPKYLPSPMFLAHMPKLLQPTLDQVRAAPTGCQCSQTQAEENKEEAESTQL
jgi:hypothetical protein